MLPKQNLYFIAIIPPPGICDSITGFKRDFADRFACKAALKLVPHLTLKSPFKIPPSKHIQLLEWFSSLRVPVHSFKIVLRDFGAFPKKASPVIFVQPMLNEQLRVLQTCILESFTSTFPQIKISETGIVFHPHITIAYRDLKPEIFVETWREYSVLRYSAIMEVNNFHLLQHDGRKWDAIASYLLRQPGQELPAQSIANSQTDR